MVTIMYGSSTLNTEFVAQRIAQAFGEGKAELHNVRTADPLVVAQRAGLVFITSTWGTGDLQDDWESFLPRLEHIDLSGKVIGLVGVGDQVNYPDNFCDSIMILHDFVRARGGRTVGATSMEGYKFRHSRAVRDGMFVGLVLDEDSQADLSDERIRKWVRSVRSL
ncbi:MAG: flavodoxin, partial [Spirochaetaceae bacterium]